MMKQSIKRMVLTGAAVTVMLSFAAPAMAKPKVVEGGPGVVDPVVDPPVNDRSPLCDLTPFGCGNNPNPVADPGENPVAEPPGNNDPVADPPTNNDPVAEPPTNNDPGNEESGTSGSGGSSGGISSVSETIDHGGTFVSGFLPTALTDTMDDVGDSVKKNLPAPVAESLPDSGGGWAFLVLVAAAVIAVGFAIRSMVRRSTSVTRTAQQ